MGTTTHRIPRTRASGVWLPERPEVCPAGIEPFGFGHHTAQQWTQHTKRYRVDAAVPAARDARAPIFDLQMVAICPSAQGEPPKAKDAARRYKLAFSAIAASSALMGGAPAPAGHHRRFLCAAAPARQSGSNAASISPCNLPCTQAARRSSGRAANHLPPTLRRQPLSNRRPVQHDGRWATVTRRRLKLRQRPSCKREVLLGNGVHLGNRGATFRHRPCCRTSARG